MKKIVTLLLTIVLCLPTTVFAHTGLEKANPPQNAVVKQDVSKVELTFETEIENTSTLTIEDQNGRKIEPLNIKRTADSLVGELEKPLPSGKYTVRWNIIGIDGHPVKGSYTFTVQLPGAKKAQPAPQVNNPEPAKQQTKPADTPKETKQDAASASTSPVIWIIVVLAVAAVASFLWISKRRSS
jgi:methionine-rich copper-binding protein CopC